MRTLIRFDGPCVLKLSRFLFAVVAWILGLSLHFHVHASEVEKIRQRATTPAVQQRLDAIKAAPAGEDKPLESPILKAAVPATETSAVEQPSILQEKVNEALMPVSLDDRIQKQSLEANLKQFGYDLFADKKSTFAPVENIPVPLDYIISPGDTFTLQVFGSTDVEYKLVVTREGKLLVPEVGDISVGGLTFEESKLLLSQRIAKVRLGVKTVVTLTDMHTIQVILMGEVVKPGTYTVSGLTSLFNALSVSGGVKTSGSLRNVEVRRQNKSVAKLDLYEILMYGRATNNIYLRHGDVIYIPPIGTTVSVAGEVNRPAIYEIKQEVSARDLLELAGGALPTADLKNAQIRRLKAPSGYTLVQVNLGEAGQTTSIRNGDQLRVYPVPNRMQNVVLLSGNVLNPGGYQWRQGMRVSDLISNPERLGQRTDFKAAALVREKSFTRRFEVQYFNLEQALENPASTSNLLLAPRDEVVVFDTHSSREQLLSETVRQLRLQSTVSDPARIVELRGFFKHGGVYPLERGMRWLDIVYASGGLQDGVDLKYAVLMRREKVTHRLEAIRLEPQKALVNATGDNNPILLPEDTLYLFDSRINRSELMKRDLDEITAQAGYEQPTPVVTISGKVRQPGRFPLTPGMRVDDLIQAAGGMTEDAYGRTGLLTRQLEVADEFQKTEQVELNLAAKEPLLPTADLVLRARDHLVIRAKPEFESGIQTVSIEGEVKFPGTYPIRKRETLCEVMQRAGGFTQDAYVFGTVFTRESVRKREQDSINQIFGQFDTLLAEVHVSSSYDNDKKLPVNHQANEIYNVIRNLKPPQAAGRMVIDMQAAVNQCSETADFVLENGDRIRVPKRRDEVTVVGQVYQPMSHIFRRDRGAVDYINLSGGFKQLAANEHAFVVQANGEVVSLRSSFSNWLTLGSVANSQVTPGSTIVVPLNVDRINGRENAQSWLDMIYKATVSAASLAFLNGKTISVGN